MKYSYVWEKFFLATNSLALSGESLQRRLANTFAYHLIHLRAEDLPKEMRNEFQNIKQELTKVHPVANEGSIFATTNEMNEDEASELIRRIISMYDAITRECGKR